MKRAIFAIVLSGLAVPAAAQDWQPAAQIAPARVLPANTPLMLRMRDTVTTEGRAYAVGSTFNLVVAEDVLLDGHVAIPRNSRAVGHVTWLTNKGGFGKSGKMRVALDYIDVMGRRVPIAGEVSQEGRGNTGMTIGAVVMSGLVAGSFITGESAVIPQGHEIAARTTQALAIGYLPAGQGARVAAAPALPPRRAFAEAVRPSRSPSLSAAQRNWGVVPVDAN